MVKEFVYLLIGRGGVRLRWMDAITVSRKCQVMEATDVDGPALKKVMD